MNQFEIIRTIEENIDYLKRHNKNLTQKQDAAVLEIQDALHELVEQICVKSKKMVGQHMNKLQKAVKKFDSINTAADAEQQKPLKPADRDEVRLILDDFQDGKNSCYTKSMGAYYWLKECGFSVAELDFCYIVSLLKKPSFGRDGFDHVSKCGRFEIYDDYGIKTLIDNKTGKTYMEGTIASCKDKAFELICFDEMD